MKLSDENILSDQIKWEYLKYKMSIIELLKPSVKTQRNEKAHLEQEVIFRSRGSRKGSRKAERRLQ